MKVFHCKQFDLRQDRSAWRCGTDSMLLGSWTKAPDTGSALDVGTGTGLLALMLAQRFPGLKIRGVEPHPGSIRDAGENFSGSPWADRLVLMPGSLQEILPGLCPASYDLLISNPPYYQDGPTPAAPNRARARYAFNLRLEDLLSAADHLLTATGTLAIVLPVEETKQLLEKGAEHGLLLQRICRVRGRAHKPVNRCLLEIGREQVDVQEEFLTVYDETGYSTAYQLLTRDFHTIF